MNLFTENQVVAASTLVLNNGCSFLVLNYQTQLKRTVQCVDQISIMTLKPGLVLPAQLVFT